MSAGSEPVIWSAAEQLPRAELHRLQLERLRATFGLELDSLEQVAELPFTTKSPLRDAYPFGLLRVPVSSLARLHASSGTHGKPTVVGYTAGDLEAWTELMARSMTMAGVRPGMLVHNANTYGLFTGGHGFHQGAERIGAPVVPVSGSFTVRQAMLLHDLGAQVLVATPSYALVIAQAVHDAGIDPAALKLELGLFGGEPWTEGLREEIERVLPGLRAVNFYGLSEMCGPGVATECLEVRDGLHVHEDHFLLEVVDPDGGQPGGAGGGVDAEDEADGQGDDDGADDGGDGDDDRRADQAGQHQGADDAEGRAEHAAGQAEHGGLDEELPADDPRRSRRAPCAARSRGSAR